MHDYKQIIDRYIEKWDKILFSTQPINRDKATKAIIDAYKAIDLAPPEIYFLSSPSLEQKILEYELYYTNAWFYDFYIDRISQSSEIETWIIFRDLCKECPYLLTYEDACVITAVCGFVGYSYLQKPYSVKR
jgi:hypothetical protein